MAESLVSVKMVRENLDDLPHYATPPGYSLRLYRPGDEQDWVSIHQLSDLYNVHDLAKFQEQFGAHAEELPRRQYYILGRDGSAVGTATAWFTEDAGVQFGQVHWVAIVPQDQGQGLSKPLLSAVCHRLRELGHERAMLGTQTVRLPAISLYLKFGFVPMLRHDADRAAWRDVRAKLPGTVLDTMKI